MIVVEGPDGAGKTTLINDLATRTGLEVAPRVVSKDTEAMVNLVDWVEDNTAKGFQATIFDRHRLISEPIYGPAMRAQAQPGFDNLSWFHTQLSAFYDCNPLVIYCLPPRSVVWENIMKDDDNRVFHGAPQLVNQIYGAYFNKATTEHILRDRTWLFDYTDPDLSEALTLMIAQQIKDIIR